MYLSRKFINALALFSSLLFLSVEAHSQNSLNTANAQTIVTSETFMQGSWYSPDWEYGFAISGNVATITEWNNTYNPQDKNGRGDVVLKNLTFSETGFTASHLFYDGSWIDVKAVVVDKDTIRLSGRRELWEMTRKN